MKETVKKILKDEEYRRAIALPDEQCEEYTELARGEYNVNYLFRHPASGKKLVLRINVGSQMHLDRQIEYEAHALSLLSDSGHTPNILYVDGSKRVSDHGFLVMEFLNGHHPDYINENEMDAVMKCMADIHAVPISAEEVVYGEPEEVPRDMIRLIAPRDAASAILDECEAMASVYMESPLGDSSVKERLSKLLRRGREIVNHQEDCNHVLYRCCINTELNSTNFLIDGDCVRLVDWEKPLYGDPAQDIAHLLAPTTTFWKTDVVMDQVETERLIRKYLSEIGGRFDISGLRERTLRLINITCLRGLSWCSMAWVEYKNPDKLIVNESTEKKLEDYLSDAFLCDIEARLFG